jgi:hypothetical protein
MSLYKQKIKHMYLEIGWVRQLWFIEDPVYSGLDKTSVTVVYD